MIWGSWGPGFRTSWQSSVHPKTLCRCLGKWARKRHDASPQNTCCAERNMGTETLEVPRVWLRISGVKSGTIPETPWKRSQSKFRISRFRTVEDPQTLENKADSLPRLISELCYSQYGWDPFLFWKAPSTEQPELVMKFLTGGTSEMSPENPKSLTSRSVTWRCLIGFSLRRSAWTV